MWRLTPSGLTRTPMLAPRASARSGGRRAAGREVRQRLVPEPRVHERLQVVVGDVVVVDERADRLLGRHRRQPLDVLRRTAEAGAAEQVLGAVVVPVGGRDRRQIILPGGRSGRPVRRVRRGAAGDAERQNRASRRRLPVVSSRHRLLPSAVRGRPAPPGQSPHLSISILDARPPLSSAAYAGPGARTRCRPRPSRRKARTARLGGSGAGRRGPRKRTPGVRGEAPSN